MTITC